MPPPDVGPLEAVAPSHMGSKVHLYADGYQPGKKRRSSATMALCSSYISPQDQRAPFLEALHWPQRVPTAEDNRPQRRWCLSCIGHAAAILGITDHMISVLAAATLPKPEWISR